jgi:hypothetical protein
MPRTTPQEEILLLGERGCHVQCHSSQYQLIHRGKVFNVDAFVTYCILLEPLNTTLLVTEQKQATDSYRSISIFKSTLKVSLQVPDVSKYVFNPTDNLGNRMT